MSEREPTPVEPGRTLTPRQALRDLRRLRSSGVHYERLALAARWGWHESEVAALVSMVPR